MIFYRFFVNFGSLLGVNLGPLWGPRWLGIPTRWPQDGQRCPARTRYAPLRFSNSPPRRPKMPQDPAKTPSRAIFDRFLVDVASILSAMLGICWYHFQPRHAGHAGANFALSWAMLCVDFAGFAISFGNFWKKWLNLAQFFSTTKADKKLIPKKAANT